MPGISLTNALRSEYRNLFETCSLLPNRQTAVQEIIAKILPQRSRYEAVSSTTEVPWFFISAIHEMESSLDFTTHLHNGDPLSARTVHVPSGRPKAGTPPFSWEDSARDALTFESLSGKLDWSLPGLLYQLERYNGWGYRLGHPYVLSPYLWSFSNHYTSGKYIADGTWSDSAVSKQCGAAVILRRMTEMGLIEFPDTPTPLPNSLPLVSSYASIKPTDSVVINRAKDLQTWLNTFPGIFLKVDGFPSDKTSEAFRKVTGIYLPNDPRG